MFYTGMVEIFGLPSKLYDFVARTWKHVREIQDCRLKKKKKKSIHVNDKVQLWQIPCWQRFHGRRLKISAENCMGAQQGVCIWTWRTRQTRTEDEGPNLAAVGGMIKKKTPPAGIQKYWISFKKTRGTIKTNICWSYFPLVEAFR